MSQLAMASQLYSKCCPLAQKKLLAKSERGDIRHPAVLVISPLVSLITDQVNKLEAVGQYTCHYKGMNHCFVTFLKAQ